MYKKLDGLEELINNYRDLITKGYKTSEVFKRMTERMQKDPLFTATELVVGLCIAYDDEMIPIITSEILRFAPLVFQKLQEMGLKSNINKELYLELQELIKE